MTRDVSVRGEMGMWMHRRPVQILAVLFGIIVVFVSAFGLSGVLVLRTVDQDALTTSRRQVGHLVEDLVRFVETTTLDYAKWDDAAIAVAQRDENWLYSNIGASATLGEAFQLAVVWGGPFEQDLGWLSGGAAAARSGFVMPYDLALVGQRIALMPRQSYEGTTFFLRQGEDVFTATASRIESLGEGLLVASGEAQTSAANLLLGVRVDEEALHHIEAAFHLSGVKVVAEASSDELSFPLPGSDGRPVAFIAWDPPRPSAALLARLLPGSITVVFLALVLSGLGLVLVRRNVADLVFAERQASLAARTDPLTGLPNRAAFNETLAQPARAGERAILFLDINGFKRINDTIGHAAGDKAVMQVGQRLSTLAGPSCLLARIAGDEFVFIVQGTDAEGQVQRLAAAVQTIMAEPFHIHGHDLELRLAMGYAVQDIADLDGHVLVGQADLAMYEAKRGYGHEAVGFSAMIATASQEALSLEQALRRALTRPDEFSIAYQPIVDHQGKLVRAEALARWTSRELGPVPPDRFIAVAEQAGLIVELGRRLLDLVCRDLAANPQLRVSVNVSPLQLMAPDFTSSLLALLSRQGIASSRMEIELTEAVVVDDARLAASRLSELHAAGFSTALDDFGTGYSSIGYLGAMPFDTLKIDRSFVSGLHESSKQLGLLNAMIAMAHHLHLRVVCEGVETQEELELIRQAGCDLAQGYHLDRPLPLQALVARWLHRTEPCTNVA